MSGRQPQRNIVLVGFHQSGKTTVGRELARRLHRPFVDIAVEAQRRQRLSLFQITGLGRLPDLADIERRLTDDLAYRRETVAALGAEGNWDGETLEDLSVYAYVVYLDPPWEVLLARLRTHPDGAALLAQHGPEALQELWARRRSDYLNCDLQLTDSRDTPRRLVQLILHCFYT